MKSKCDKKFLVHSIKGKAHHDLLGSICWEGLKEENKGMTQARKIGHIFIRSHITHPNPSIQCKTYSRP